MRPLTTHEADVLRAVAQVGAPDDDELRTALLLQVELAQVVGPSCGCGCASVRLAVDARLAPPVALRELSADTPDSADPVGFRVLLADGYLVDVEVFSYGDVDATQWPAADELR